jgi:tetratricopeptide (TPR) repeat protein
MSSEPETRAAPRARRFPRRLLVILLGLAILAVSVNFAWWLSRPALEPLPTVAAKGELEPQVRSLLEDGAARVAMDNRSAAAWGDLGAAYFVHNFEAQAQVCFRNAERLDPRDYRWPYLLGVSLIYADADQMLAAYRRAAERCGERAHVHLRLAEALLDRGELEGATEQIAKVLQDAPSNPRAQFAKARLLVAQGKLDEARSWAERSAIAAPDKRAPHLLLAHLCRRAKDAPGEAKALAALERIPDGFTSWEDPDIAAMLVLSQDRASRLAKAEGLAQSGDPAAAKDILYELAVGSDDSSATTTLARALNREGKYREAEALLRRQLPGSPNDERLHFVLGNSCFQQERYQEAETEFRRAIELKPDYTDAWHNLGLTLLKLRKPGDARVAFAATVRLSPSSVFDRINLAELLLAEGKTDEAREHLVAAIKLAPEQKRARELLARTKAGGK